MADVQVPSRLSFAPEHTQVVLIGTSETTETSGLDDLPGVKNNVQDLAIIFRDPGIIGLPNVTTILDPANQDELATTFANLASKATDTLIVYYAGHGLKANLERGLYLATKATTKEHCDLNGFSFTKLRSAIANSPALKRILILDCCFAGEALNDEMGDEASLLASNIDNIKGTYAIASSPANKLSIAPVGERYTAFTSELIGLLKEGTGSNRPVLTLDEIFDHLRRRIALRKNLPEPQRKSLLDGSEIIFARNHMGVGALELRVTSLQETANARLSRIEQQIDALSKGSLPQAGGSETHTYKPLVAWKPLLAMLIFAAQAIGSPAITTIVEMKLYEVSSIADSRVETVAIVMLLLTAAFAAVSFVGMLSNRPRWFPELFSQWYPARVSFIASAIGVALMIPLAIIAPEPVFTPDRPNRVMHSAEPSLPPTSSSGGPSAGGNSSPAGSSSSGSNSGAFGRTPGPP